MPLQATKWGGICIVRRNIFHALRTLQSVLFLDIVMKTVKILVVLNVAALGCLVSSCSTEKKAPAAMSSAPPAVVVGVKIVEPQPLEKKIYATGTILANEEIELRSEIAGRVTQINFTEGAPVARGKLLVKINDADLQAKLSRLQAEKELADAEERRQRHLIDSKLASDREYDAAASRVKTLAADIQLINAEIAKTEIRSPIDGIVGLRWISNGGYVTTSTPIARVQQLDRVKIDFSVPEKYAATLKKNAEIDFSIAGSERQYKGVVYAIEPKIDLSTRTVKIRAIASNGDRSLVPGAFAKVLLILDKLENTIVVPTGSLISELNGQKVFVYANGVAQARKVTTGIRTDSAVQIIEGIAPNDTLIVSGLLQVRDKAPVKIKQL
jgi:membrane fusion protein (multidrug efflux system)